MRRAFTVIELLMAVALTLVIGLLVNMAFNNTQLASRRATSSLEFLIKGRAIMDMIADDISNSFENTTKFPLCKLRTISNSLTTIVVNNPYGSPATRTMPGNGNNVLCTFKSQINQQNAHYYPDLTTSLATAQTNGFYAKTTIDVGWYFGHYKASATDPDKDDFTCLFRRISSPTQCAATTIETAIVLTDNTNATTGIVHESALITKNDIREFSITPVTVSGKVTAYEVHFVLTNAPIYEKESDNTAGIDTPTNDNFIDNRFEAEQLGYIWIEFDRTILLQPK